MWPILDGCHGCQSCGVGEGKINEDLNKPRSNGSAVEFAASNFLIFLQELFL